MRLLLPGFLVFLIWSAATLVLYQNWFLDGPEAGLAMGSMASGPYTETPDMDQADEKSFKQTDQTADPAFNSDHTGPVSPLPINERLRLTPGTEATAPWLPDPAASAKLENWAQRLSALPGSGIIVFCNYTASEAPSISSPGRLLHPAVSRGNAVRKALFGHGIQPAQCTFVFRQVSDEALRDADYAHLVFAADDPVPWSPSFPVAWSAFAQANVGKELPAAGSGEWGMLLTRHLQFGYGSSSLPDDPETRAFFENLSEYLNRHPEKSVCITGHTCDISSAGFNQRLGAARAAAVRQRLLDLGIAPDRLQADSAGEEQPIGENNSSPGQQANRRVELLIR